MKDCGLKVVILANFLLPNGCFISQTSLELHIVLITGIFSNMKYEVTFTYHIIIACNNPNWFMYYHYRVWEYGGYASKGLEQVAKWGSPRVLESELKAESLHIRTIIKARGLWYPNHNGKTFAVFRTDRKNHLVSLV